MDVDGPGSGSSSISSPPGSPQFLDTIQVARLMNPRPNLPSAALPQGVTPSTSASSAQHADPRFGIGMQQPPPHAPPNHSTTTSTTSTTPNPSSAVNGSAVEKPKRQRKKKEVGPDGKPIDDGKTKPKAPRKPREPKDKTGAAASTTTAAPRKRKAETATPPVVPVPAASSAAPRQPTISEMVSSFPAPAPPSSSIPPRASQPPPPVDTAHRLSGLPPASSTRSPVSRPASAIKTEPERMTYEYDPVRGTYTAKPYRAPSNPPPPVSNGTGFSTPAPPTQPQPGRASTSASIASLIDPPSAAKPAPSSLSHSPKPVSLASMAPQSHSPQQQRTAPTVAQTTTSTISASSLPPKNTNEDNKMDVDLTCDSTVQQPPQIEVKAASKASSAAPTPKVAASRPTPPPAPVSTGSGLLSSSDLFGGPSKDEGGERQGVNIDIEIKLNPSGGNTINIAQEILKKYGADAINPRAAAHRARLLKIAAAASKIDGAAGDDMSVDLMSDMDGDSNVEMGGMDDGKSGADTTDAKPKKRRKIEDYDKEDDFIDDTELAWQEQAAVAKDGFFVYSGPLIPAGELLQVESAAPTRGRGRGRGARARAGAATSATTHAAVAEKKEASALPARGRGSRGGARGTGVTRKPRITKADRERMETEKIQRERAAANLSGPAASAPLSLPSTPASTAATASQSTYQLPTQAPQPILGTTA